MRTQELLEMILEETQDMDHDEWVKQIFVLRRELQYYHTVSKNPSDAFHRNPGYFDACTIPTNRRRRFGKGTKSNQCMRCDGMNNQMARNTLEYHAKNEDS